jgi:DNA-binding CsgD family transcriptional regulator
MNDHLLTLAERLRSAPDSKMFWDLCHNELEQQGVSSILYGVVPFAEEAKLKGTTAAGFFKTTHCREWIETIGENQLLDDELTTEILVERPSAVLWHDESQWENATQGQKEQNQIELDLGLNVGISFSLAFYDTDVVASGSGLNMPGISAKGFTDFWRATQDHITMVSTMLDNGMRNQHGNLMVGLTARERDILTYLAIGMQREAVAYRLKISAKTLDHHIRSAKQKLEAGTTAHAVAKALVMGVIRP